MVLVLSGQKNRLVGSEPGSVFTPPLPVVEEVLGGNLLIILFAFSLRSLMRRFEAVHYIFSS